MTRRQPSRAYPVPAAAVVRHVQDWMRRMETAGHDPVARTRPGDKTLGPLSATAILAERTGRPDISRVLWRIRHEVAHISLKEADMFITAIDPSLWHADPELHAAYLQEVA